MTKMQPDHASSWALLDSGAEALRPPKRVQVSEGAAQNLMINQPGGYSGPWSASETPYMVEPMDLLASRRHEAVVFVGPARTGKTMGLLDGWVAHAVVCDPGDMLIVQMTQEKAREYSKVRIDRAIRYSPGLKSRLAQGGHDDNTHDKLFRHGMWLKIGWPTASQLSGSDYRYVALTDYDRMDDNIDGEGSAYGLGLKRTQTFLSRGMCMVESSPGREITDPRWKPATAHEGPPCTGIVGIYNRSDRRRWYWPCPDCGEYFEAAPGLALFATLPAESELLEIVRTADLPALADEHARIGCPHCGSLIGPEHKPAMLAAGRWLADGQHIDRDGQITGLPIRSSIAGYWLGGVAAAYQGWRSLLLRYLQGLREYVMTGSEETLKNTVNTDQGAPYLPRALASEGSASEALEGRAEKLERYIVPEGVRTLIATVDVQGGKGSRFEVAVTGYGQDGERWIIDRYALRQSERTGADGKPERIDPAAYPEDWDVLTSRVINSTYRLPDGRELRVHRTAVDLGGEEGVSDQAYDWWRRLKRTGQASRVMLVKGASGAAAPRIEKRYPDTRKRKDRGASSGDVPVWFLNGNLLKDAVWNALTRPAPGPNYVNLPEWLPAWAYEELTSEVRIDGKWEKIAGRRNETWDLLVYAHAVWIELGGEKIKWEFPPPWAAEWDRNLNIMTADERRDLQQAQPAKPLAARKPRFRLKR